MPKMKTHKGLAKRIKISKTGKIKRRHAMSRHLLNKKSAKRKRRYKKYWDISKTNKKVIKELIRR